MRWTNEKLHSLSVDLPSVSTLITQTTEDKLGKGLCRRSVKVSISFSKVLLKEGDKDLKKYGRMNSRTFIWG
jgi:hypothetical protein